MCIVAVSFRAATWCSQCNLAKLLFINGSGLQWSSHRWGGGTLNSRQLFALIVRCGSALLTVADALLINGKRCIYILISGTRQLRWRGARCWLHSGTNPTGFPFSLIVTNPIEKRLIYLLTDCLVDWEEKLGSFEGEAGAQGERQKAQSFYDDFSPKIQKKKTQN